MTVEPFKVQAGETYSRFDGGVTQPLRAVVVKGKPYFQDGHGHIYDSNGYPLAWRDPDHIRNVNDRLVINARLGHWCLALTADGKPIKTEDGLGYRAVFTPAVDTHRLNPEEQVP